jgi:hypothetical protein
MMKVTASLRFGNSAAAFFFVCFTCTGFVLTAYQEFVTHRFYLGIINGPTEGVLLLAGAQVGVGLCPALRPLVANAAVVGVYFVLGGVTQLYCVLDAARHAARDRGARARAAAIAPAAVTVALFAALLARDRALLASPWFTMAAGLVLCYQAQQIIVAHVVGAGPRSLFNPAIAVAWAVVAGAWLGAPVPRFPTYWHFALAVVVALVLGWDLLVIRGLAVGLGIPVLTLPRESPVTKSK